MSSSIQPRELRSRLVIFVTSLVLIGASVFGIFIGLQRITLQADKSRSTASIIKGQKRLHKNAKLRRVDTSVELLPVTREDGSSEVHPDTSDKWAFETYDPLKDQRPVHDGEYELTKSDQVIRTLAYESVSPVIDYRRSPASQRRSSAAANRPLTTIPEIASPAIDDRRSLAVQRVSPVPEPPVPEPPVPEPPVPEPPVPEPPVPEGLSLDQPESAPIPIELPSEAKRYAFNFQNAPWPLVLKQLCQEAGLSLQLHANPPGNFSYFDSRKFTLTEAMDLVNDYLLAEGYIAIRTSHSLHVQDAKIPIPEGVVRLVHPTDLPSLGRNEFASIALPVVDGLPAAVAQELQAMLSPFGTAKPLSGSQRVLVTDIGSSLQRVYELNGPVDGAQSKQQTFVYQLRNTPAEDVALAISNFVSGRQVLSAGASASNGSPPSSNASSGIGGNTGGIVVIPEKKTNSLLIRGTPEDISEIQELIVNLDRLPEQVVIQALLVEVELGNTDEFGVELGVQDSVLFNRSVVDKLVTVTSTTTGLNGSQTTNQRIVSQTSAPGFNFNNQPLGNNTAVQPSAVGSQGLTSFGVGRVNGDLGFGGLVLAAGSDSISVLLRALQQQYNVDILSRPQIRAVHNHEAMIQIGKQVPVVDGVSITAVGSANPVIRQDSAGLILKVTPRVSPDGQVMVDVKAEKSHYQLTPGTGVPIFTDATNGNVIEAPIKDITTANTTVNVMSGETIVLGGMITRESTTMLRKVPWLGDVPYVGELFKYNYQNTARKELLIFLTPMVIRGCDDSDQFKLNEMRRMESLPIEEMEQIHGSLSPALDVPPPEEMSFPDRYPTRSSPPDEQAGITTIPVAPDVPHRLPRSGSSE